MKKTLKLIVKTIFIYLLLSATILYIYSFIFLNYDKTIWSIGEVINKIDNRSEVIIREKDGDILSVPIHNKQIYNDIRISSLIQIQYELENDKKTKIQLNQSVQGNRFIMNSSIKKYVMLKD